MGERVAALAFLAGSVLYLGGAFAFPVGTMARPGAGYFPVVVGGFLCAVAVVFAAIAFRRARGPRSAGTREATIGGGPGRVRVMALGLVAFCLVLPWLGYPLAAFGLVALLLRRLGDTRWTVALGTGVVSAAVSYWVFAVLLSVPLPKGLLGD